MTVAEQLGSLRERGYVVLEGAISRTDAFAIRDALAPLCGPVGRNVFEGLRTQRAYALLRKTRAIDALVEHPAVLQLCDAFLDNALLSAALVVNLLGGEVAQPWHFDGEYFGVPRPRAPIGVSTVWALDDFTEDNGATDLVPGSHLWKDERPSDTVQGTVFEGIEPTGSRRIVTPEVVKAVMPAGSVIVFFDNLFHRSGANTTSTARFGLTIQYCQGWARGLENMCLSVPPETAATLSPRLQELIGYSIHHAFVGYVDGRHPKKLLAKYRDAT